MPSRTIIALITPCLAALCSCTITTHPVARAALGAPIDLDDAIRAAAEPGPLQIERVVAAEWVVDRSGLLNLDHAHAQHEGLDDGLEPIQIVSYAITHPTQGRYLIDSGIARSFRDPDTIPLPSLLTSQMHVDQLMIREDTATWLAAHGPIQGVFLTHIHLDHVLGLQDVPIDVPAYVGPTEGTDRAALNLVMRGSVDRLLGPDRTIESLAFDQGDGSPRLRVVDVFGDRSLFALHTPGHTSGHLSFLARTPTGAHLITGDASHTAWGWSQCVEPGSFSADIPRSARSLHALRQLAARLPHVTVYPGHQLPERAPEARACEAAE